MAQAFKASKLPGYQQQIDLKKLNKTVFERQSEDRKVVSITSSLKYGLRTLQYTREFYARRKVDMKAVQNDVESALAAIRSLLPSDDKEMLAGHDRKTVTAAVEKLAESIAANLYISCHAKFQEGRLSRPSSRKALSLSVLQCRNHYVRLLTLSLERARKNDVPALLDIAEDIGTYIYTDLAPLLVQAGASSETDLKKKQFYGLSLSDLSRRYIMLAVSLLTLSADLKDSYSKTHLLKAAKRFRKLWREDMKLRATPMKTGRSGGKGAASIKGKLNYVKFYNRPQKPFTSANIIGTGAVLIAPYKSLLRMGVTNGSSFWAMGKIKKTRDGKTIFELEYEGLEPHSSKYWEDYLAYKYKRIFNLYPNAYRMIYEYPDLRRTDAFSGLQGHIQK